MEETTSRLRGKVRLCFLYTLRQAVPRDAVPADVTLELGFLQLQMQTAEGQLLMVRVVDLGEGEVTLDANNALAGLDLTFESNWCRSTRIKAFCV